MAVTSLLTALRSENKRIQQALCVLEGGVHCLVAQTHRKVIPIHRDILASDNEREVVDHAYDIWLSSGFRGASPEEALFTAVRQLGRKTASGLFLVPKRRTTLHPFPALRRRRNGSAQ